MRIACIHLPSFPLQAALVASAGADLHVRPVAVVSQPPAGAPVVLACSRAAWSAGVRPTMTASVARALVADLECVIADVSGERALLGAAADSLLAVASRVDPGGEPRGQHHCMYLEVPSGRRGTWFGARVLELLGVFGLRGRIGIADDRFTAYVAASVPGGASSPGASAGPTRARSTQPAGADDIVCVPRGGSAAFLAPHPLALLRLAPEVQHMLEALGVRTLGAFAALPPPSVTRAATTWDADFQALARGDGGSALDAYRPAGSVIERVDLGLGGVGPTVDALARRLGARLAGRGAPAELRVRLTGTSGVILHDIALDGDREADDLADAIGRLLGDDAWTALEVVAAFEPLETAAVTEPARISRHAAEPMRMLERHDPETAPLILQPTPGLFGRAGERPEHRRTRRGKQRPRIATGQARLFAGD